MSRLLMGTAALVALTLTNWAMTAGAVSAQSYYGPGPRPPYATGAYVGVGFGEPDCSFTIAGAHAGVTVLGINVGGGARIGIPGAGACQDGPGPAAYPQPYAPPPQAYQGGGYPQGGYYNQGAYAAPAAYPQPVYAPPPQPVYGGYSQPCGCQAGPVYQPY